MRTQRPRRTAFTITEMLVATALILFIMAIISQVFASASKTYTALRVAGDMQERMRSGSGVIRRDLTTEHFEGPFLSGRSGPRVGDQRMDQAGWSPPPKGYFEMRQFGEGGSPLVPVLYEPGSVTLATNATTQPDGLWSSRGTTHVLRFTVKLPDLAAPDLYVTDAPTYVLNPGNPPPPVGEGPQRIDIDPRVNSFPSLTGKVYSRWAEIQYFLFANGDSTPANATGTSLPLYSLRRRVRVLAPAGVTYDNVPTATAATTIQQFPELPLAIIGPGSLNPNPAQLTLVKLRFFGPDDVTNPANRMPYMAVAQKAGVVTGDDILIADVLSMEIKGAWLSNALFNSLAPGSSPDYTKITGSPSNSDDPYDNIPPCTLSTRAGYPLQRVFDTWYRSPNSDGIDWDRLSNQGNGFLVPGTEQPPLRINVRAIQMKIRVYDRKAEQARQMTIGQEI